jgi:hypothetical protein
VALFLLLMSSEIFEELPENQFSVLLFLAIGRFASGSRLKSYYIASRHL